MVFTKLNSVISGIKKMNYLSITDDDKILIVAPHPDDECIGAGGLLALYSKQCDVLVLTDGRIGQSNYLPNETIKIRRTELEKELSSIGVNFNCYGVEDGTLSKNTSLLCKFDFSKYTKIFVTGTRDGHPDHSAAYSIVKTALKMQKLKREIYLYEVHNPLINPTHILDITKIINNKLGLIQCHKSQLDVVPYDRMAKSLAEYRAVQNRMANSYIEVFELDTDESEAIINPLEIELQKQRLFYKVLTKWIEANHKGWNLGKDLKSRGYTSVCVYGFAELGRLASFEIEKEEGIELSYILDKKLCKERTEEFGKRIAYPDKYYENVDCVIVSAVYNYEEIKKELTNFGYDNVLSLYEIIKNVR